MNDQLIMTTVQREQLQNTLKQCWHTVSPETDPLIASSEAMLQSLPMVDSQPVTTESLLDAVVRAWCYPCNAHKTMDADLALAMCTEVSKLYTSPQALTPITTDDVTDEMLKKYDKLCYDEDSTPQQHLALVLNLCLGAKK